MFAIMASVDSLVNGSLGEVVGFKRDSKNRVKYVLVKFDDPSSGQERRKQLNFEEEFKDIDLDFENKA